MKTLFPGMNPYIERQEWQDFHTRFNTAISEALSPKLSPHYAVRVERRIYVETVDDESDDDRHFRSDAAIILTQAGGSRVSVVAEPAPSAAPVEGWIKMEEERRETYLVVRDVESHEVVTVLETLSPANKRLGGDGRREYLKKRREVLNSPTHFVEIDLLRGGTRMPVSPATGGDYNVIVSREWRRPKVEIFTWHWRSPLPLIQVPLKRSDGDVPLDLQAVFSTVCERADYDLTLNYEATLEPPLAETDVAWLRDFLTHRDSPNPRHTS